MLFPAPAASQEEGGAYTALHNPANDYFEAIEHIEAEHGPYAMALSDLYLGLGQSLLNSGDFEKARDAFHRGVLVVRVNAGPNSPEQTNHLFLLANLETMLGDMEMADEVLHNIRFINSEYYDDDNPELLPVLERIYQWYLVARPPGSHLSRLEDYERMIDLAQQMEQVSETAYGASHPETALAYRRLGDAEFQMVRHLTGMGFTLSPERYVIMMTDNVTPLGLGAQPVVDHYDDARKAYKRYLDALAANASTTPLEYAEALADLGDWYMVFEKIRKSSKLYEQAYQVLAQSPDFAELAEQWMSQPKPMHFATENLSGYQDQDGAEMQQQASRLNISMTVTHYGKVLNIEVLQPPENLSKDALVLIKNQLRGTPFRPAMRQGEVVTTRDFIWQYELMPPWGTS